MKRVIDFQVSIAGLPSIIQRVEYESKFKSDEEIKSTKFPDAFEVMREAERALGQVIGHNDYSIEYWYWIK